MLHTDKANSYFSITGIHFTNLLRKLADVLIVMGFTVFMGGGVQLLIMLRGAEGFSNLEGDLPSQLLYLSVYIMTLLLVILTGSRLSFWFTRNLWFWLLLFWTLISVLWSGARWVTTRHIIALAGTTFFAVYLVNTLDIQKYIRLLAFSLLIITVSSYIAIVLFPHIGIGHVVSDEWKGIFTHKNHLGKAASLSFLIFFYLLLAGKKRKWVWLLGWFASIGLLIGSQSAAAIMLSIFIGLIIGFLFLVKRQPVLLWVVVLAAMVSLFFYPLPNVDRVLEYFRKDETLTGRTMLWDFSIHMISKKPVLGYGYGAFWLGSKGPSAEAWAEMPMGMDITHAHNGFIDILLGIGGVGFFLAVLIYLSSIMRAIKLLILKRFAFQYSIYLLLLLWILLYNITELALLDRNSIFWVLFSSIILYQAKSLSGSE